MGGTTDDDADTADADAARVALGREEPDAEDAALAAASVAERHVADADDARIDGRRSLVGRTAGADSTVALLLEVACVGVASPSELCLSFSPRSDVRGLVSVS